MTTINVNAVEPAGATLTIGEAGDTVKVNDSVNVNTVKDAGGNTLWVSNGSGVLSSVNSAFGDALVLLSTQTASSDSEIDFTSVIDSTYKEYIFSWVNIHPATNNTKFTFQANVSGETGFNETITSASFTAMHREDGSSGSLFYDTTSDQAEGTSYQPLTYEIGNAADASSSGVLHLFNPSSTTYVKNFYSETISVNGDATPYAYNEYISGYFNVTGEIIQVSFAMSSGNIDAGTIKMYGVK